MIGVDIVDLADPLIHNRDENHLRFILNSKDIGPTVPHRFWCLWAAKEAIFKTRRIIERFDPKSISVQFGSVKSDNTHYFTTDNKIKGLIIAKEEYIFSLASEQLDNVIYDIQKTSLKNTSSEIRQHFIRYYQKMFGTKVDVLTGDDALPIVQNKDDTVSFTHHGRFMAFGLKKN